MTVIAKRVKAWKSKIVPGKAYPIDEALGLIKEFARAKFNESVDVAVNLGIDASKSDANRSAISATKRLLPMPPSPVIVTRLSPEASADRTASSSASRPKKGLRAAGVRAR